MLWVVGARTPMEVMFSHNSQAAFGSTFDSFDFDLNFGNLGSLKRLTEKISLLN